jgi:hypothetical protein
VHALTLPAEAVEAIDGLRAGPPEPQWGAGVERGRLATQLVLRFGQLTGHESDDKDVPISSSSRRRMLRSGGGVRQDIFENDHGRLCGPDDSIGAGRVWQPAWTACVNSDWYGVRSLIDSGFNSRRSAEARTTSPSVWGSTTCSSRCPVILGLAAPVHRQPPRFAAHQAGRA